MLEVVRLMLSWMCYGNTLVQISRSSSVRGAILRQIKVNWSKVDSNISIRDPLALDMIELMGMTIRAVYKGLNEGSSNFGHLAGMASYSKGQLGALNAESFCERCLSCANLVVTDGNALLLDEEVSMLVELRMNVDLMEFMRQHYAHLIVKQPWKMTIVK